MQIPFGSSGRNCWNGLEYSDITVPYAINPDFTKATIINE